MAYQIKCICWKEDTLFISEFFKHYFKCFQSASLTNSMQQFEVVHHRKLGRALYNKKHRYEHELSNRYKAVVIMDYRKIIGRRHYKIIKL